MMKTFVLVLLALLLLPACSGKDAIEATLQAIPPPPTTNVDLGIPGGDSQEYKAQSIPAHVPEVDDGTTYHGLIKAEIGTLVEFTLVDGNNYRAIDVEYRPTQSGQVSYSDFSEFYVGTCPNRYSETVWFELTDNGDLIKIFVPGIFDSFSLNANSRYVVRFGFTDVAGCNRITSTFNVQYQ